MMLFSWSLVSVIEDVIMGIIVSRSTRKTITVIIARNIQTEGGIGILNTYSISTPIKYRLFICINALD